MKYLDIPNDPTEFNEWRKNEFGRVYFVRDNDTGRIKIGSTMNFMARMYNLRSEFPAMTILKVIKGYVSEERRLQKMFRYCRYSGEWFYPDKELLSYIHGLTSQPPDSSCGDDWRLYDREFTPHPNAVS